MFRNYIKVAFRNIMRNRVFSAITIFGLAAGLTCSTLIMIFVLDEFSYDEFHSKKERIYRLRYHIQSFDIARVPPVLKGHMAESFPGVENSARLWSRAGSIKVEDPHSGESVKYEEDNLNFADDEIFKIFDFTLVEGSLENALKEPYTVIINEEIAQKYFKDLEAVGRNISIENKTFKVIAVLEDFPSNSHVHFDMLLPYENMYDLESPELAERLRSNLEHNYMVSHSPTYILLKEGATKKEFDDAFPAFIKEHFHEAQQIGQSYELQPLLDIHLNDAVMAQSEPPSSPQFVLIFAAVGLMTLLIACINFINLNTAKSYERAKEIGMRKVMGAWRSNIITQFLGESFVTTFLAALLAIIFVIGFLPLLNEITQKELGFEVLLKVDLIASFVACIFLTAIIAGTYPAFFASGFRPIKSLKNQVKSTGNLSFRRILIIAQFSISIVLITGALIINDQLNFLKNQSLGFNKEFMIIADLQSTNFNSVFGGVNEGMRNKMNAFENEISEIPGVVSSTASSTAPGFSLVNRRIIPEGYTLEDNLLCPVLSVDYDFIETYQIPILEGRDFDKQFSTDATQGFVINERAVREFNFGEVNEAVGKKLNLEGKEGIVLGVAKDFNFASLVNEIEPVILEVNVPQFSTFTIRLNAQNMDETISKIEEEWNYIFPEKTFEYQFLDEALAGIYQDQERLGELITYFAILAILISCLGSYGLIIFVSNQKRKEIGIRKVLGANVTQLVLLLSKRFLWLSLISILLAAPISVYLADYWLADFNYRVDISPLSILIASAVTVLIVLLTVSFQSIRTAFLNPVVVLKDE